MAKGDDIEARLIRFAVRIIKLCVALPDTPEGRHIRGQLIRSGQRRHRIMPKGEGRKVHVTLSTS
jgi:hypothetical protein